MRSFVSLVSALALLAVPAFAAPQPLLNVKRAPEGHAIQDEYIVRLKDGVSRADHLNWLKTILGSGPSATGTLSTDSENWTIINAYAGVFKGASLLEIRSNPDVDSISENQIMRAFEVKTQTNATWGLARLSQTEPLTKTDPLSNDYTYLYDSIAGSGVDVYIIDTGINVNHDEFEGRASWGFAAEDFERRDGHGHGTHCAGTAVSRRWGVAKKANVIAVKVLSDEGSGSTASVISGVNYVVEQATKCNDPCRPSIASLSLGGLPDDNLDEAMRNAIEQGVHVAVAAGNESKDASSTSPARVEEVCTVGASDIKDSIAYFSNYGPVVDIFAPGVQVTSTWIGKNNNETNTISGTSMATPHIAGLMAYLLSTKGQKKPQELVKRIQELGTDCALSYIHSPVPAPPGTRNDLARSSANFDGSPISKPATMCTPGKV